MTFTIRRTATGRTYLLLDGERVVHLRAYGWAFLTRAGNRLPRDRLAAVEQELSRLGYVRVQDTWNAWVLRRKLQ